MSLHRLSNSVYARIHSPPGYGNGDSNKGYIICREYVVVVDTTYFLNNPRSDLEELKTITEREVGYVINTHYHPDHAYGNGLFTCEIIAQKKCPELMKELRERQLNEIFQEVKDPHEREILEKVRYPSMVFDESYRLDSEPAIEVIHLGGHTPDLSVVHVPEEGVLFASDDLFGSFVDPSTPMHPFMAVRSDLAAWILALKRILGIEANIIVPGHGGVCNKKAVNGLIEYLELFISNVRELKEQGYSKEEVKRRPELLNLPKLEGEVNIENNIETQYDKL